MTKTARKAAKSQSDRPAIEADAVSTSLAPVTARQGGPTLALVLGGGGARGLAHVHALSALDDLGIRPVAIAGTSIGALIGAGAAHGMRGDDLGGFLLKTLGNRAEVFARLWRLRPRGLGGLPGGLVGAGRVDLEAVLKVFMPHHFPHRFEDLSIPLTVVATDYYGQRATSFHSGPLFPALAASAAIPALFKPVRHEGRILIDGGIANPVPFDVVAGLADITLAIDVVGGPTGDGTAFPSTIDALFGASQLMMQSIIAEKLLHGRPDIFLRPNVDAWRVMDFLKVKEILRETLPFRDEVKRAMDAAITAKTKDRARV
jgi:NTE family protein